MALAKTKRKKLPRLRIHVNQHVIRANKRDDTDEPPIGIEDTQLKHKYYAHEVYILGPSKLVYSPDKPLKCGARLWLETDGIINSINRNDLDIEG